jgi:uncharacterized protein (TIGR00251 family)
MTKQEDKGITLAVKVSPKASRSQIVGWENGELRIRLAAVPEKGEANRELIRFLAKELGIAKAQIELLSGDTSRHKRLFIRGLSEIPFIS